MQKNPTDKRVVKTKSAIRRAFNELVQTKDVADITVRELTELAEITRSTFYMYYSSVLDVRYQIEKEIMEHVDRIMNEQDWVQCMVNPYPLLSLIGQEVTKYDRYNKYLLCPTNSGRLFDMVTERVVRAFTSYCESHNVGIDVSRAKYVAAFTSAGICECFKMWSTHESRISLEELCQKLSENVSSGVEFLRNNGF